jgi:hypothetical protein
MKLLLRLCAFALLLSFVASPAYAALDDYIFSQYIDEYEEITDGDEILEEYGYADDTQFTGYEIGFDFYFNGTWYDEFNTTSNCAVWFGSTTGWTYSNPLSSTTNTNCIVPFGRDMIFFGDTDNSITYKTIGDSPNRVCVIQFKGISIYYDDATSLNIQVRLFESSNNIQIIYGDITTNGTPSPLPQVGLKGSSTSDFDSRKVTNGTNDWSTSVAGTLIGDNCYVSDSNYPDDGLVYEWSNEPMVYGSNATAQVIDAVPQGGQNQPVIRFNVMTDYAVDPISATGFTFNTNGCDDIGDLATAKVYYTGGNTGFSADNQFGDDIDNPDGELVFSDEQDLLPGNNYFWLAYDLEMDATLLNVIDGEVIDVTIYSPTDGAETTYDATTPAPEGNRTILAPLAGTYYIGDDGDYPNLSSIFADANALGLSGDVTCEIISDFTETDMAMLGQWGEVGDGDYTWTITHDGTPRTVTLNNFLVFDGADRVIVDGGYNGDNYLTINNTMGYHGIVFTSYSEYDPTDDESEDDGLGANNNTVKNVNINVTVNTSYNSVGVGFLGSANNENVVENCNITGATFGIYTEGGFDNEFLNNNIGSDDPTKYIQLYGMNLLYLEGNTIVKGNSIFNIIRSHYGVLAGVYTSGCDGMVFAHNKVHNIINNVDYASRGIWVAGGDNNKFVNNEVYYINAYGYHTYLAWNPQGIYINGGGNNKFLQNTVHMYGEFVGSSYSGMGTCFVVDNSSVSSLDVRNNIFVNQMTSSASITNYAIYAYPGAFGTLDYNNYWSNGSVAYDASAGSALGLSGWQSATEMDENSANEYVYFMADDDLHLNGTSVGNANLRCPVINQGDNEWYAGVDMDGEDRTNHNNVMGVDIAVPTGVTVDPELSADADFYCIGDEMNFEFGFVVDGFADGVERTFNSMDIAAQYTWFENGEEIVIDPEEETQNYEIRENELTVFESTADMEYYHSEINVLGVDASTEQVPTGVEIPLAIEEQPSSVEACVEDTDVVLSIDASGTIIGYQWQIKQGNSWYDIEAEGANSADFTPYIPFGSETETYRVIVYGPGNCGDDQLISDEVQVVVYYPLTNIYMSYDFDPQNLCFGDDIVMTANVEGTIYGYQWQKEQAGEWIDIDPSVYPTARGNTLHMETVNPSHSGNYRCMIFGSAVCETAVRYTETLNIKVWPLFDIVRHPQKQNVVCRGDLVSIDVVIDGHLVEDDPYIPTYQWYKDGRKIDPEVNPTANDPILYIDDADYAHSGAYSVEIYKLDCRGQALTMSERGILYVLSTPEITEAPKSRTAELGDNLHFEVKAHVEGAPTDYPIYVQWFKGVKPGVPMEDGEYIEGAQASILNLKNIRPTDYSEYYYVEVTGHCGTAQSDYFAISEKPMIDIDAQPEDVHACPLADVTFTVEASVSTIGPMMHYQWRYNGNDLEDDATINGATTNELTLIGADAAWAGTYDCVITLDPGDDTKISNGAELTFVELPVIIADPVSEVDLQVDDMLELAVVANGDDLMYQWYKDGDEIAGATESIFSIGAVTVEDAGIYIAKVYNDCAEVMSDQSVVTVTLLSWSSVDNPKAGEFTLLGNTPNPTNGTTRINFIASAADNVRLVITDMYGREVAELINGTVQAGEHTVEFNVNEYDLSSGIYFYSLVSNGYTATKRMVIIK